MALENFPKEKSFEKKNQKKKFPRHECGSPRIWRPFGTSTPKTSSCKSWTGLDSFHLTKLGMVRLKKLSRKHMHGTNMILNHAIQYLRDPNGLHETFLECVCFSLIQGIYVNLLDYYGCIIFEILDD